LDFDDALTKPVGMRFEVVPGKNPRHLKVGDVLPIQVFFDGVPLQAGKIYRGRGPTTLATDSGGAAQISLETKGWQKVVVIHDVPALDEADIDFNRYFAFLVFEIM
jgi:nickel transport protein